jgi:hypothetical protein
MICVCSKISKLPADSSGWGFPRRSKGSAKEAAANSNEQEQTRTDGWGCNYQTIGTLCFNLYDHAEAVNIALWHRRTQKCCWKEIYNDIQLAFIYQSIHLFGFPVNQRMERIYWEAPATARTISHTPGRSNCDMWIGLFPTWACVSRTTWTCGWCGFL